MKILNALHWSVKRIKAKKNSAIITDTSGRKERIKLLTDPERVILTIELDVLGGKIKKKDIAKLSDKLFETFEEFKL